MTYFTNCKPIMFLFITCLLIAPAYNIVVTVEAGTRINGKIAFYSNRDGNQEIYVMNADGTGQTRLTTNSFADWDPSWSPDGTKIAFNSDRNGNNEIYVMNADSSAQTRLTTNSASDSHADWSPDGTKIAFYSNRDGQWEIYVMIADGLGQTKLTGGSSAERYPDWSPDGNKIVFTSNRDGNWEVYVMNTDGSGQTRLTTTTADEWYPDWSPDGKKIIFTSNRNGNPEIYIMNVDGSGQTRLTSNDADDYYSRWQSLSKQTATLTLQASTTSTKVDTDFFLNATLSVSKSGNVTLYWSINGLGFNFSQLGTMTNGKYSWVFGASNPGVWAFKVVWAGDDTYESAESNIITVNVNKQESSISCSTSSTNPTIGDTVIVSGITPLHSGATVTISYKSDGSWNTLATVTSAINGSFSYSWTPSVVGSYQLKATWAGDDTHNGASSDTISVTVKKISTSVSCSISSSTITNGDTITTTGSISPAVSGITLSLTHTKPDGTTKVTRTVTTNADGSFSDSFKPDTIGAWSVKTSWGGDATHEGASSTSKSFNVNPQPSFFETPTGMAVIVGAIIAAIMIIAIIFLKRRKKTSDQ